jgi:integrase
MRIDIGIYHEKEYIRWKACVGGLKREGTIKAARTNREAIKEAKKQREKAIAEMKLERSRTPKSNEDYFYEHAKEKFLESLQIKLRSRKIKETTIRRYSTDFRTHLDPFFSGRRLSWMNNPVNLLNFQNQLLVKKKQLWIAKRDEPYMIETEDNLSHASINRACELVRTFLNIMAQLRLIQVSEFNLLLLDEDGEEDEEIPYLENDVEITRFLNAAKNWKRSNRNGCIESPYYDLYFVAIHTGLRKGEIKGLNEEDIDFDKGSIYIRRQWLTSLKRFGPTKSGEKRYVSINPETMISLKSAIAKTKSIQKSHSVVCINDIGAVFSTSNGKRISGDAFCANHLNLILKQAGLNPEITFHGLRRTFANRYYRDVGKIQPVQEMLGHKNESTTRIYLNLSSTALPPAPATVCER